MSIQSICKHLMLYDMLVACGVKPGAILQVLASGCMLGIQVACRAWKLSYRCYMPQQCKLAARLATTGHMGTFWLAQISDLELAVDLLNNSGYNFNSENITCIHITSSNNLKHMLDTAYICAVDCAHVVSGICFHVGRQIIEATQCQTHSMFFEH